MPLIRFLKESENARKLFGKRELAIIEKQLYGVVLTQSEKNRLSRDIRPKLALVQEAAGFAAEFPLKKGSVVKELVAEAVEAVKQDILFRHVEEIRLFGSAAENALTLQSDIDISVKFSAISLTDATAFRKRVAGKVDQRIDVQVYNHLPENIQQEIQKKGKVLYARES